MTREFFTLLGALVLGACARGGAPVFWVLDPDAGVLATLDERLVVLEHERLEGGRLLALDEQSLWGARCAADGLSGQARLFRRAWAGGEPEEPRELVFGELVALVADERGGVFALDRVDRARTRLWHVEPWLERRFLGEFAHGTRLAAGGGELLLASETGELLRLRRDGAVLAGAAFGAPVDALAPGPEAGEWYVLGGGEAPRVARLARTLEARWSVALARRAHGLAAEPGRERLWLVEGDLLLALGAGGARELELPLPVRGGPYRPCVAEGGRAWLAGTGALLEIDSAGGRAWIARSQGGFDALASLVSVRAAAAPPRATSSRRAPRP